MEVSDGERELSLPADGGVDTRSELQEAKTSSATKMYPTEAARFTM